MNKSLTQDIERKTEECDTEGGCVERAEGVWLRKYGGTHFI